MADSLTSAKEVGFPSPERAINHSGRKPRIGVLEFQGKSRGLIQALISQGHEVVDTPRADVLLIDFDGPWAQPRQMWIEQCIDYGGIVLIYPHAGPPMAVYDGITHPDMRATAHLVQAPGHAEVFRRFGFPLPAHVVGWYYCELLPFAPPVTVRRVLFGPMHPLGDGTVYGPDLDMNLRIYEQLLRMDIELTVQMVGTWDQNGLWPEARVRQVSSNMHLSHVEIDKADVVIAGETLAYLGVARGKPVVMPSQPPLRNIWGTKTVQNLTHYKDYMSYPYDLDDGRGDVAQLIAAACKGGSQFQRWREFFIGEQLRAVDLSGIVTRLYVTRRR